MRPGPRIDLARAATTRAGSVLDRFLARGAAGKRFRESARGARLARLARLALVALLSIAAASCERTPAPAPSPGSPAGAGEAGPRGPVVVSIVVDQLAAWIAWERWPALPRDGGFARLVREGTWVRALRFAHACTDTAPGHAALYTGATPHRSGIFGNEWITATGEAASILADAGSRVVAAGGVEAGASASLRALRVETIADRLRATRPEATIASFSLKERAALFAGGRAPDLTLWYDRSRGSFVTSTAVTRVWPAWLPERAARPLPPEPGPWTLLDAGFVESHAATPDLQPGEGDYAGLGVIFPHPAPSPAARGEALRVLPTADEVLLDLALAAVDRHLASGRSGEPMLLGVSLSAHDYVGHVFGPDSWESWNELRSLDAALARFFAALDERLGAAGWAALLAGDHGIATMPEALAAPAVVAACAQPEERDVPRRSCAPGRRLFLADLAATAREAAERALGARSWIAGASDPYVYYAPAARELDVERRALLDGAVAAAIAALPGVERAVPAGELPAECPPETDESIAALLCRSHPAGAGGEITFVLEPGAFVDSGIVPGKGTNHGSPHLYDRTVPLVVRAPGRVAAGRRLDAPLGFRAFARTAAALLGIEPPAAARDGLDLTSATAASP